MLCLFSLFSLISLVIRLLIVGVLLFEVVVGYPWFRLYGFASWFTPWWVQGRREVVRGFAVRTWQVLVLWFTTQELFLFVGLGLGCLCFFLYRVRFLGKGFSLFHFADLQGLECRVFMGSVIAVVCGRTQLYVSWSLIEYMRVERELTRKGYSLCQFAMIFKVIALKKFYLKEAPLTQCLGVHSALMKLCLIPFKEDKPTVPFQMGTESQGNVTQVVVMSQESHLTIGHWDCSYCEHQVLLASFSQSGHGYSFSLLFPCFVKLYWCPLVPFQGFYPSLYTIFFFSAANRYYGLMSRHTTGVGCFDKFYHYRSWISSNNQASIKCKSHILPVFVLFQFSLYVLEFIVCVVFYFLLLSLGCNLVF